MVYPSPPPPSPPPPPLFEHREMSISSKRGRQTDISFIAGGFIRIVISAGTDRYIRYGNFSFGKPPPATLLTTVFVFPVLLPNVSDENAGDSTSTATRFSDAAHVGILLLGCCFVGVCATAAVYAKRLAANAGGGSRERRNDDDVGEQRTPATATSEWQRISD